MTRITHIDVSASRNLPMFAEPLFLMSYASVEAELVALRQALKLPARATAPDDLDDEEWQQIIENLISFLGCQASSGNGPGWGRVATDRDRQALAFRMAQALTAVRQAGNYIDGTSNASGLLLPASYVRRVRLLLGFGQLPLAWVRCLDVARV